MKIRIQYLIMSQLRPKRVDVKAKWDPEGKVSCLPVYEHNAGAITLMKQKPVNYYPHSKVEGWDERW